MEAHMVRTTLSPRALAALADGDIDALLAFHAETFGDALMKGDDDEDDDGDDDGGDDDEDDEDDDEDDGEDWKTPESKTAALRDLTRERKRRQALEKQVKQLQTANESVTEKAIREAKQSGADEITGKYKGLIVRTEAKSMLLAAGLKQAPARFVRMIDLDEVEVDDDGTISGLEDQIDGIKTDFPELFPDEDDEEPKRRRRTSSRKPGTDSDRRPPTKAKSSAEKIAASLG
jgi:hypothetical protein